MTVKINAKLYRYESKNNSEAVGCELPELFILQRNS